MRERPRRPPRRRAARGGVGRRALTWLAGIAALLLLAIVGAVLFAGATTFGADSEGARLARIEASPQWRDGRFRNPQAMWTAVGWREFARSLHPGADEAPSRPVPVMRDAAAQYAHAPRSGLRATWFGHSSTLVEIDGIRVLTDPLWSRRVSPVTWAGPKPWFAPPLALSALPPIDAVLISHDHYDHLDYDTIAAMRGWTRTRFIVPLGIGADLEHWGIAPQRIVELDWWQSARIGNVEIVATPARHASGRIDAHGDRTLWSGFALLGPQRRVWYSGDTGLSDTLHEIGARYGPFDLTMIEVGQYDASWPDWHLGPEQAVEAHRWVRGRTMLPVHWALLHLASHGWTEPIERTLAAARCAGVAVATPLPGQAIEPDLGGRTQRWWPQVPWADADRRPVIATKHGDAGERYPRPACPPQRGRAHAASAASRDAA
jgi:L-ascorbate metabolism protein UlaG (beta-lactamase superfamily)